MVVFLCFFYNSISKIAFILLGTTLERMKSNRHEIQSHYFSHAFRRTSKMLNLGRDVKLVMPVFITLKTQSCQ